MNDKNELKHYGVLGMRWGHRRAKQNASLERHGLPQPKNNLSKYKNVGTKLNDMRKESAKNALRKDIASLDKHGMKDQADALRENLKKMENANLERRGLPQPKNNLSKYSNIVKQIKDKSNKNKLERAQKKWDKRSTSIREYVKAYNKAADYANKVIIPKVNKKYEGVNFSKLKFDVYGAPIGNSKLAKAYNKYIKEYKTQFNDMLVISLAESLGPRPS